MPPTRWQTAAEEAAALAVKMGCDLNCGATYPALVQAVQQGLIDEATLDVSVKRLFTARFRLGMFDPPEMVPYAQIPYTVNDSPEYRALALRAARESIVLLKNEDRLLPLDKNIGSIAVIGPNADDLMTLLGNYCGTPSQATTVLEGLRDQGLAPHPHLLRPGLRHRRGRARATAHPLRLPAARPCRCRPERPERRLL